MQKRKITKKLSDLALQQMNLVKQLNQIKRTRFRTCIGIALLAAVLVSLMFSIGLYSNLQLRIGDYLYGGGVPLSNIAIVSIDDRSIQEIGRWPWERGNFTELLGWLDESKVVAFDVAFFEESDNETDMALARAVHDAGNVVMPVEYLEFEKKGDQVFGGDIMEPVAAIKRAAAQLGYINVATDFDGVTRAANMNIQGEYDHFTHAILKQYLGKDAEKKNRFLVNYIGRPGAYTRYSFRDVLNGQYEKEEFKDKIILIGATATDLHDAYLVPTSAGTVMPGVEVHANTVQQLITGRNLEVASSTLTVIMIFIVSIGIALMVFYLPMLISVLLSLGLIFLYIFVAIFIFNKGIILNIVYVTLSVIVSYVGTVVYLYISEKKSKKKVMGAFGKYVSKDVIKHIMENPERLKLGGEKREITVFFSDIRGFTTISEKLSPEQLVALLNEYLTEMTNIILKHNGVVDKYMGDAIMAFWNAPLDQPKHAERACLTCLDMEDKLKELQKKWTEEGVPPLEIGIGLNTGQAVVGNMGSFDRFDYTAMGDTVNLGSRLESINKQYGTRIIISESTKNKVADLPFVVRKLDQVMVKGKKEPITIYELVSTEENAKKWYSDVIAHFEKGLELYFKQKWDSAIAEFKKADKARKGGDPSSIIFIERCEFFKKESILKEDVPGKDWDGVWIMKTK
ncbi:MAG: adenylate/guanylate cyclase domain-containing protein [Candidatus Woesearchaeota archaeon]